VVMARYLVVANGPAAGSAELRTYISGHPSAASAMDALGLVLWNSAKRGEAVQMRKNAMETYRSQGRTGRADAISQWLETVDPSGDLRRAIAPPPGPQVKHNEAPPMTANPQPPAIQSQAQPSPQLSAPVQVSQGQTPGETQGQLQIPSQQVASLKPVSPAEPPLPARVERAAVLAIPEPLPFAPGSPILTGSGVLIEGGRLIVTNRHVVEGVKTIAVRSGTGHVRKARVVRVSSDDDLALLEIDHPFPEHSETKISDIVDALPGRTAVVMGYPLINVFGDEQPALTEGIVAKSMGLGNDPGTFQMTAKINKGNSGGPVFDRQGHLLGVTVGKADGADVYQKNGTVIEDMNIAIKASRIRKFLGRPAQAEEIPNREMSLEELYQKMLPRAVLVAAQK